jgi:hypothetical protein
MNAAVAFDPPVFSPADCPSDLATERDSCVTNTRSAREPVWLRETSGDAHPAKRATCALLDRASLRHFLPQKQNKLCRPDFSLGRPIPHKNVVAHLTATSVFSRDTPLQTCYTCRFDQFRPRPSGTRKAHGEILVDRADNHDARISSPCPLVGRCVFCSREFDVSFLYCPFCGRRLRLPNGPGVKWYFSRYAVAVGLGTLGPLALPLVWFNPRYTVITKVSLTVLILVLTALILCGLWWCCMRLLEMTKQLMPLY